MALSFSFRLFSYIQCTLTSQRLNPKQIVLRPESIRMRIRWWEKAEAAYFWVFRFWYKQPHHPHASSAHPDVCLFFFFLFCPYFCAKVPLNHRMGKRMFFFSSHTFTTDRMVMVQIGRWSRWSYTSFLVFSVFFSHNLELNQKPWSLWLTFFCYHETREDEEEAMKKKFVKPRDHHLPTHQHPHLLCFFLFKCLFCSFMRLSLSLFKNLSDDCC